MFTHAFTHTPKKTLTYIHTFIYTHVCICIYTSVYIKYIFIYAYTHRLTNTYKIYSYYILHTHTHSQAYTHTSIHKYIHPLSLSLSHTHTHTHTHTASGTGEISDASEMNRKQTSAQARACANLFTFFLGPFWHCWVSFIFLDFMSLWCMISAVLRHTIHVTCTWFLTFYDRGAWFHPGYPFKRTSGVRGFTPPKIPLCPFFAKNRTVYVYDKRTGHRTLYVYN